MARCRSSYALPPAAGFWTAVEVGVQERVKCFRTLLQTLETERLKANLRKFSSAKKLKLASCLSDLSLNC